MFNGVRPILIEEANKPFIERDNEVVSQSEQICSYINETIKNTTPDSPSFWGFAGFQTKKVTYVDVSKAHERAIDNVVAAFTNEGYFCNKFYGYNPELKRVQKVLAIVWDPNAIVALRFATEPYELVNREPNELDNIIGPEKNVHSVLEVVDDTVAPEKSSEQGAEPSIATDIGEDILLEVVKPTIDLTSIIKDD